MDLNVYNIHTLVGLFGKPKKVYYEANIERGIDTSGILTLDSWALYDSGNKGMLCNTKACKSDGRI